MLIPRGGAGLIRHCVETSKVPVIETGTGNCHVYLHGSADLELSLIHIFPLSHPRRFSLTLSDL